MKGNLEPSAFHGPSCGKLPKKVPEQKPVNNNQSLEVLGHHSLVRLVSEFHHYFSRGLNKTILLMVQKSGVLQLTLVVYPIIYSVLYIPRGAGFLPSTVTCHITLVGLRTEFPVSRQLLGCPRKLVNG